MSDCRAILTELVLDSSWIALKAVLSLRAGTKVVVVAARDCRRARIATG